MCIKWLASELSRRSRNNLCVTQSIRRKREAAGNVGVPPAKVMREDFPELVRKTILHKWEVDGKECLIKGKVLKAVSDINDIACMFQSEI